MLYELIDRRLNNLEGLNHAGVNVVEGDQVFVRDGSVEVKKFDSNRNTQIIKINQN